MWRLLAKNSVMICSTMGASECGDPIRETDCRLRPPESANSADKGGES